MNKNSYINGFADACSNLFDYMESSGFYKKYNLLGPIKGITNEFIGKTIDNAVSRASNDLCEPNLDSDCLKILEIETSISDFILKGNSGESILSSGRYLMGNLKKGYSIDTPEPVSYNKGLECVFKVIKEVPSILMLLFSEYLTKMKTGIQKLKMPVPSEEKVSK